MSVTVEKKEHNMAVLTVTASAQELTQALNDAWKKDRKRINIPGFRRGKAPRKMIEQMYGKGVFFEDAANLVLQRTYDKAVEESGETVVSRPKIDITQIEEGKPFIYTAEVALKPAVTLGQYKGVEVAKTEISPAWSMWMTVRFRRMTTSSLILTEALTEFRLTAARQKTMSW